MISNLFHYLLVIVESSNSKSCIAMGDLHCGFNIMKLWIIEVFSFHFLLLLKRIEHDKGRVISGVSLTIAQVNRVKQQPPLFMMLFVRKYIMNMDWWINKDQINSHLVLLQLLCANAVLLKDKDFLNLNSSRAQNVFRYKEGGKGKRGEGRGEGVGEVKWGASSLFLSFRKLPFRLFFHIEELSFKFWCELFHAMFSVW